MHPVQKLEFQLDEADRLIAAFGNEPAREERQSLEDYLRGQKDRYVEKERVRLNHTQEHERER